MNLVYFLWPFNAWWQRGSCILKQPCSFWLRVYLSMYGRLLPLDIKEVSNIFEIEYITTSDLILSFRNGFNLPLYFIFVGNYV